MAPHRDSVGTPRGIDDERWFPYPNFVQVRPAVAVAGYVAAVVAATMVLIVLPAGRPPLNSLWAEDGSVFLQQALDQHWYTALFTPSEGYMHLVPRLFAMLGTRLLPLSDAALLFGAGSALLRALLALFVWRASAGHVRWVLARALLAGSLILVPSGETLDNIANLHWYLVYAAVWAAAYRPRGRTESLIAAVVVFAAICSDPIAFVVAPIILLRCIMLRRPWEHLVTAAFVAAAAIQLTVMAGASRVSAGGSLGWAELVRTYDTQIVLSSLVSEPVTRHLIVGADRIPALLIAFVVLILLALPALLAGGVERWLAVFVAGTSLVVLAICWRNSLVNIPYPSRVTGINTRYSVIPMLLVIAMAAISASSLRRSRAGRWIACGIAVVLIGAALTSSLAPVPNQRGPLWRERLTTARRSCLTGHDPAARIPIDPPRNPRNWGVSIPCARLSN